MANRLLGQNSPYLLQHAENPVGWHPWDDEALAAARAACKPIFLSIGYSACHWCHVMAHESFEDPEIAGILNREFIPIKVDREERPELDQLYMEAVQMMTGHGGWPMSVFLTPELEPFYGGTYWPPEPRGGMPGFREILVAVADVWKARRRDAVRQAKEIAELLRDRPPDDRERASGPLSQQVFVAAENALGRLFDPVFGGFGPAPKFPRPIDVRLLLRRWFRTGRPALLTMVNTTLGKMAAGGMYDHLGGGFHRYSVDNQWLVPHFEKMLYDNALLAECYAEAWQATGEAEYARVARQTLDYVLRDMTDAAGGFYSSEDADSEGHEGRFYVWTPGEIRSLLGRDAAEGFCYVYDVTEAGNFEHKNILSRSKSIDQCARVLGRDPDALAAELAEGRQTLFDARLKRVRPGRDDKVLTSWNGLMIGALARAGAALDEPRYVTAALRAVAFALSAMRRSDGRLWHCWRRGQVSVDGLLEDYAALADALVTLYEASFNERWIDVAVSLVDQILARFSDPVAGGFYTADADHGSLLVRKKDMVDSSVPSGGGLATSALLRLGRLCGRNDYLAAADAAFQNVQALLERMPLGVGQMLVNADFAIGPTPEIVITGSGDGTADAKLLGAVHRLYLPSRVTAFRSPAVPSAPRSPLIDGLFEGRGGCTGEATLYVCENHACQPPVCGQSAVLSALFSLGRAACAEASKGA